MTEAQYRARERMAYWRWVLRSALQDIGPNAIAQGIALARTPRMSGRAMCMDITPERYAQAAGTQAIGQGRAVTYCPPLR